ncbi:MAG: AAA family ATPase [Cyclobacteriaceae bacterium]
MAQILTYSGKALEQKVSFEDGNGRKRDLDVYIPSSELINAVNLTIQLKKRPLLLMSEPGCGKTRLAEAVAYELHKEKMYEHYFRWDIKSTSKAKDGIYRYDALSRLHDVNLGDRAKKDVNDLNNYIEKGKLARAFTEPQNSNLPNILLIDEIDKADIDFPNDLLLEIENKSFNISELGEQGELQATSNVIIFITSNQEKELPSAFLRRCLFHLIEFPDISRLKQIVQEHIQSVENDQIDKALEIVSDIRNKLDETDKKPSTSELIDWFTMLDYYHQLSIEKPAPEDRTPSENELIAQLDSLDKNKVPYKQILLKTAEVKYKTEDDS